MKQILLLAACLLTIHTAFAQAAPPHKGGKTANKAHKNNAIGGYIKDARNRPIPDVEAFVYKSDSTIAASGYTDSSGHYETTALLPGKYDMKIIYPSEKTVLVTGVIVKKGVTNISLTMPDPPADSLILYVELLPKPAEKKKPAAQDAPMKKKK
jgi:hypothetical protein